VDRIGQLKQSVHVPQCEQPVIARNFLWLISSQIVGGMAALFGGIYSRRVLGAVVIGQYSWSVSVLSYFSLLTNPGLVTIAKRDVARNPNRAPSLFSQLLALQLSLALSAFGLLAVLAATGLRGPMVSRLLMLVALGLLFVPFDLAWLLQAHERMAPVAIAQVVVQILKLPILIWLVRQPDHVMRYAVLSYPFQLGLTCFLLWYATSHGFLRWEKVRLTFHGASRLVREALPVGLSQVAILLYYNFDAVLLGFLSGDRVVGIYTTAYSIMLTPTLFSGALSTAYFPRLSRLHGNEHESAKLSSNFLRLLVWMGMPLAALGWAFGRYGLVLLYGRDFAEGGQLFEWMSLNLALIFFNVGIGNPLDAWGLQMPHFRVGCVGAVFNVALNCLLIPPFGAWAAVVATLLSEVVVGVGCLRIRNKHVRLQWWTIVTKPVLVCLAAAIAGRCLAFQFPNQWFLSLTLIGLSILVAFWMTERTLARNLLASLRNIDEPNRTVFAGRTAG
jgi:O-antigen/teichoic acid export membrane protein